MSTHFMAQGGPSQASTPQYSLNGSGHLPDLEGGSSDGYRRVPL